MIHQFAGYMHFELFRIFRTFFPIFILFFISLIFQDTCFAQADECGNNSGTRGNWFYQERVYPYDTISSVAITKALTQEKSSVENNGYYLGTGSSWTDIGPKPWYGINQYGPNSGRVSSVKFLPFDESNPYSHNPNILYIAGHNGGLWKSANLQSNNDLVSFTPMTDKLATQSSGQIAIDPTSPSTVYYATGGSVGCFVYNYPGIGVYRSDDGGVNWAGPFNTGIEGSIFSYSIVVSKHSTQNNHDIYLALGIDRKNKGLFRSLDGGITWNIVSAITTLGTCNDVAVSDYNNGQYIFAIGENPSNGGIGLWVSSDYGATFSNHSNNSGISLYGRSQITISKADNRVYLVTYTGSAVNAYVSVDFGTTFSNLNRIDAPYQCMPTDFLGVKASPSIPGPPYFQSLLAEGL